MDRKLLVLLIIILVVIIACIGVYSIDSGDLFGSHENNLTGNNVINNTTSNDTVNSTDNTVSSDSDNSSVSDYNSESLNNNDDYYEMVDGEKHELSEEEYAKKYPDIYKQRKEGKFEDVG